MERITSIEPAVNWQDMAVCRGLDPDLFYPERGMSAEEPKQVCRGCPVRIDCLSHAIINNEKHGVWGGATERERRRIMRKLAAAALTTN